MLFLAIGLIGAMVYYVAQQALHYWRTPHEEGDPILYVERGCLSHHSRWSGWHYDTVIVTKSELILNDVLTFYHGYSKGLTGTHWIKKANIVNLEHAPCVFRTGFSTANVKVTYAAKEGSTESFFIKSRDPHALVRNLIDT